ncbi:hypothetical protein [Deinococcus sp. PEB2-63]
MDNWAPFIDLLSGVGACLTLYWTALTLYELRQMRKERQRG